MKNYKVKLYTEGVENFYIDELIKSIIHQGYSVKYVNNVVTFNISGSEVTHIEGEKYEVVIEILEKDYVDSFLVSLVRVGMNAYLGYGETICFTVVLGDTLEEDKEWVKNE